MFAVQLAALSESILIVVPPFLVLVRDWILPDGNPIFINNLFNSILSCNVLRCESFDFLMLLMRNCRDWMPSLAAIFGWACGGG